MVGDTIFSELIGEPENKQMQSLADPSETVSIDEPTVHTDLLVKVIRSGQLVCEMPSLDQIRQHAAKQRSQMPGKIRPIDSTEPYPVGLESRLAKQKADMIAQHS